MKIKNTEINQLYKPYQSTIDFEKFLKKYNVLNTKTLNILDAGCGLGANLSYFANRYPNKKFIGWDYSAKQIKLAKYFNPKLKNNFYIKNILNIKNSYTKFDLIYSIHTICVFKKIENVIKSISKLNSKWIAINSLFYDGEMDALIHIRDLKNKKISDKNPDADFNIHSLPNTKRIFKKYGYKLFISKQYFPKNKIKKIQGRGSYTIKTELSKNTTFSGPVFLPWYFLLAKKLND